MISVEKARSGHSVLRKDGRLLSSSFDPMKEATTWTDHLMKVVGSRDHVIVLGLGSGYHVLELTQKIGVNRVTVLERDPEVTAQVARIFPVMSTWQVIVEPEWMRFAENPRFRDALSGVYRVATHGPSCQIDEVYYKHVERLLVGRDKISFLLQLKSRPDIWAILDPEQIAAMPEENISIKTLQRLFAEKPVQGRERRLWRVLEELVL